MHNKGIVGAAVLWLLVALSAIGLCAMRLVRWQKARAESRSSDVRARLLIAGANAVARATQFSFLEKTETFGTDSVRMQRMVSADTGLVRLRCVARVGDHEQTLEIGWRKSAGLWRACYWKEAS